MMRDFVAGLCTVALVGGVLLLGNKQSAPPDESDEAVSANDRTVRLEGQDETVWIKIVFGTDGEAAVWDGRLGVTGGRAVSLVRSLGRQVGEVRDALGGQKREEEEYEDVAERGAHGAVLGDLQSDGGGERWRAQCGRQGLKLR